MSDSEKNYRLLSNLKVGETGEVVEFVNESALSQRMEEMGITPGEKIEVVRFAPLNDPIEIKIRGYLLSLRREEAELIKVKIS
ncbi:MAG: ferrous iron transport protein A [Candidatus Omnitrophica bacterium]|nr:ferrous iron transport protein A [Candidatus Omnitrophota bacterium]MCB9748085.1 ferrous iron transport protein A [Candidatus Omnitrophota bacterium]